MLSRPRASKPDHLCPHHQAKSAMPWAGVLLHLGQQLGIDIERASAHVGDRDDNQYPCFHPAGQGLRRQLPRHVHTLEASLKSRQRQSAVGFVSSAPRRM